MSIKAIVLAAAAGIFALVGGGYYIAESMAQKQARETMALIEANIVKNAEGAKVTHSGVNADLFDGTMTVRDLKISDSTAMGTVTIASATLGGDEAMLKKGVLRNIVITDRSGRNVMEIGRVRIADLDLQEAVQSSPAVITSKTAQAFLKNLNIGAFVVEDLKIRGEEVRMSAAEFRVGGRRVVDISISDVRIEEVDGEVKELGFKSLKIGNLVPGYFNYIYAAPSNLFGVTDVSLSGGYFVVSRGKEKVSLGSVGIEGIERTDGTITAFRAHLDGFQIPLRALYAFSREAAHFLNGFDQPAVRLSGLSEGGLDVASGVLKYGFALSATGMGEIRMNLELAGVDPKALRQLDPYAGGAMQKIKFVGASLKYKDDKLADTVIDNLSAGDRVEFADQTALQVRMLAENDEETGTKAAQAVKNFIMAGNGFEIVAHPAEPFPLFRLEQSMEEGTLGRDLNLQIVGN